MGHSVSGLNSTSLFTSTRKLQIHTSNSNSLWRLLRTNDYFKPSFWYCQPGYSIDCFSVQFSPCLAKYVCRLCLPSLWLFLFRSFLNKTLSLHPNPCNFPTGSGIQIMDEAQLQEQQDTLLTRAYTKNSVASLWSFHALDGQPTGRSLSCIIYVCYNLNTHFWLPSHTIFPSFLGLSGPYNVFSPVSNIPLSLIRSTIIEIMNSSPLPFHYNQA